MKQDLLSLTMLIDGIIINTIALLTPSKGRHYNNIQYV
jgi:hypothetical protein